MADQEKNLILKLKLNVDDTEGKKLVTLVKEQTQSLAAITAETKKLKDAESERQKQLAAINKQIKEQINEQKAAQKTALDELNKKVTEANAKLELQVKGWQLIPTNIQAAINKYNKLQEALDKEVATKLRLLNIEKESLSIVEEAARQAARKAEFIKKAEAQAVKQKGTDYTLVEKALQESFNRRKQVQDSYNVLISELEAAAFAKKLADFKTYQSLYASIEKEANNTRLKNDKEIISAMAQAAKQAQADSLQNIKAKADLEKAGQVYADEYTAAVAKRVTSEQKITNELSVQNALMNKAVTESITLNTLEELRRSREAAGYSNYKLHLENLLQASKKITAELEVQAQLEAARSKGYSFTGATSRKSTTPALTGSGLTSATSQVQGDYSFTTAGTVAANKAKADKEAADLARTRIQKELAEQTEAAKQLYQIRMGAFKASITEQDALMQHSVALQTAVQIHGINSVQAERVRAAEATRQLERTRQATVSDVHAQVSTGGISTTEGMSRITAANKEYASGVSATTQKVHDLDKALANTTERHRNLFLRVGEAIGAYRIWNTAIGLVTSSLQAIPKIGIELESTIASLTATTGSAAGMGSVMAALNREASRTGISIGTLRETFRSFQASTSLAGESLDSTWHMFINLNTVITGLHLPADKASGIFLAMAQIFNKTKVQSEELVKQLGNLLPGAFASFAAANRDMFVSSEDLIVKMKKGVVFAHDTVEKFTQFLADRFAPAFALASQGLNANIGRMQTSFILLGEAIYNTSSGPMLAFVKGITSVAEYVRQGVEGTNTLSSVMRILSNITIAGLIISLANVVKSFFTATVVIDAMGVSVATTSTAMRLLQTSIAFLSTPTAIIAGIGAIALAMYNAKQETRDLIKSINEVYIAKANAKQATTPELKLKFAIEEDPSVKIAQRNLKGITEDIAKASAGRGVRGGLSDFAETARYKDLLKSKLEAEINLQDAKAAAGDKFNLEDASANALAVEAKEKTRYDVHVAYLDKIKTIDAEVEKVKLQFDKAHAESRADLEKGISIGKSPKANEAQRQEAQKDIALLKELEQAKELTIIEAKEAFNKKLNTVDAATNKVLKDSYKDINRDSKIAVQETETLLDELASKYASNLISIKDYYAERVALQLANVEVEKTIQGKMIAKASAAGDTASVEKARDQIELLNEKAKQFQPIADKERTNDLRTYNNTLSNTTAQYLELAGATVAATKARLELQNAPFRQQLQTQIEDTTSTGPEKQKAKVALGQVTASEEITKINAAAEAAKNYRDKINEISISYTEMGATSADVLNTTLGGFSPIFNMLNNFQTEQAKIQAKMSDLVAEGERLAAIKIEVIKAPDTEANRAALEQNAKDTEINAKQKDLLNQESTKSQLTSMMNVFAMGENLAAKGSKTQKAMHNAYVVMETVKMALAIKSAVVWIAAEYTKMTVAAASTGVSMGEAAATLVAQSGWAGFAGIAALAAIVASYAASGGGGSSSPTTTTSMPVSSPAGTVFGDKQAISTSLEDTLSLLTDINYKSYNELVKMNFYSNKTSSSIIDLNKIIAGGKLMAPSTAQTGTSGTGGKGALIGLAFGVVGALIGALFDKTVTVTKIDEGIQTLNNNMKNILTGAKAQVAQYTTLEETTETLTSTSTRVYDVLQKATTQAVNAFTAIFRNIGNSILTMANQIGETALVALYNYKFSRLKISFAGKKADDITKTLTGLVNKELDKVAMAVFGSMFKSLRDLKEGMFATVSRLFVQKEVVKGYFTDLGASFTVDTEEGIRFADALVRVSSSATTGAERLKEFAKQQEDFFNNFATTLMKNNKTVADFAQGLSSVFNQGLSVDQVSKTKALVDYNNANKLYADSLVKNSKLLRAEANLAKAKTPGAIRTAEKALLPLETLYNAQVATAQENLTKATANYNVGLNGSIEAYQTLKDVFFNTVATTGDFGAALIEVKKNLDLTTDSGRQAFVMLNNLSNEFNKLFDAIIQPIKNQITTITDSIDATSKEDLLKQLTASRDFESQKNISVKIQKLIVDKYTTEKTAINNIKTAFINLAATVKTLLGGDLSTKNPYEKLQLAQTEYTDLLAKSRSTDLTVASDAASKLGASAQAYLTDAKSYYGATAQYADIFNSVTTTLSGLSQTAEAAADASTVQLEILGKAAIAELSNLADVTTKAVLATLEEGIKALDITDTTKIATDELLTLAMKADNLGIAFDALIAKFNQEMATPVSKSDSGIQALVDKLTAARLAGDTKEMAKINKQIAAYNKGFGKGGTELGVAYASNRLEYENNLEAIAQLNKDKAAAVGTANKKAIQDKIDVLKAKNSLIVKAGAYADGGRVSTGMSLVGERGPELIQLPMGTNVIKNSTTNRLLEDSNKQTIIILTDMKKELIILNDRMGTIERKTRLTKSTLSMA